jgi:hypothetical protein
MAFRLHASLISSEATPRNWQGVALPYKKEARNGKAQPFRTARAAEPQRGRIFKPYVEPRLITACLRDGVEKERVGRQRLPAILRAKAEKVDAAFAQCNLHESGFALDSLAAEQPARKQRV